MKHVRFSTNAYNRLKSCLFRLKILLMQESDSTPVE